MAFFAHVVVRPSAVQLRISGEVNGRRTGRRIVDFPGTGQFISIDKLSGHTKLVEGQNSCATFVDSVGHGYSVAVTVVAFSPSDRFMFRMTRSPLLSVTIVAKGVTYASGSARIETESTRVLSSDSSPTIVWQLLGSFPIVRPGVFIPPPIATKALINAATSPLDLF